MPLRKGNSPRMISSNIEELMHSYEDDGMIGNVRPKNKKHAQEIAAAIAYRQAREGDGETEMPRRNRPKKKKVAAKRRRKG